MSRSGEERRVRVRRGARSCGARRGSPALEARFAQVGGSARTAPPEPRRIERALEGVGDVVGGDRLAVGEAGRLAQRDVPVVADGDELSAISILFFERLRVVDTSGA